MEVLQKWHKAIAEKDITILDNILSEDIVFFSPVLWAPQKGKMLAKMYLTAAFHVLGGEAFHYEKEIVSGKYACLEFETKIGDTVVNGVDIITVNDSGLIVEFKVMVRPIRALMAVKDKMFELLQKMQR